MPPLTSSEEIARHRTAMVRHTLSKPMSLLVRYGLIRPGVSVFDYGCGQGDDLRGLAAAGIKATGWDPHYAPDAERCPADIVNLGFVLNVIEAPTEREAALRQAWALAGKTLAVSTMVVGQVPTEGLQPYNDGFLTSRGTFQKYFQHSELRDLVRAALGVEPVAAGAGIFFVFREASDAEEFQLSRRMGARLSSSAYRPPRRERAPRPRAAELGERIPLALAAIEEVVRLRGRPPGVEEIGPEAMDELAQARLSLQRAIDYCLDEVVGPQELESAAAAMREDLLVHYALGRLNRSETSDRPSAAMVRDIRAHFGSQRNAQDEAIQYLMSLARAELIEGAIADAARAGLGAQDQKRRLVVQARRIAELPGILRLYLACAAYLAGDPEEDWLVRIEPARKKVSYFPLEDADAPLPRTREPVLIDLARQTVVVTRTPRLLLSRSIVMGEGGDQQRRAEAEFRENKGLAEPVVLIRLRDI